MRQYVYCLGYVSFVLVMYSLPGLVLYYITAIVTSKEQAGQNQNVWPSSSAPLKSNIEPFKD